jgi:hypothetical protein
VRATAAALAVALVAVSTPLRAEDEAAALLAKHQAYVGWQFGDGTITSLRTEGTYSRLGKDGQPEVTSTFTEIQRGVARRRDIETKRGSSVEGFTGSIFWRSDVNGFTLRVLGEQTKYLIAKSLLFDEATAQMPGIAQGTSTIDGKPYSIVRVGLKDQAFPIDLYIDPATGRYGRAVIDPGGRYETTFDALTYADALPGKKLIASWRFGKTAVERTKIQANAPVSDDDLHPPAQTAHWAFTNDQPIPIEVTDERIFVTAKINGVPGHFLFDTGAGGIFVSAKFSRAANLTPILSQVARGIGPFVSRQERVKAATLDIGGNVLHDVIMSASRDNGRDTSQEQFDGLLGCDFLAGAIVGVDLHKKTLSINDPGKTAPAAGSGFVVSPDLSSGTPVIPMRLNNTVDVLATLDSGDFMYVLFSPDLVSKYKLRFLVDPSSLASQLRIGGVGGEETGRCGQLGSLDVGPINYQGPPACELPTLHGREILVGFDFLKNFDLVFDYPDGQMVLYPHK